ncbi:hypothetical protein LTR17_024631 [Elasticomyces elasticus]|nr:hypothetical protein LTR17_024631 [Elasticomyces elasticus]
MRKNGMEPEPRISDEMWDALQVGPSDMAKAVAGLATESEDWKDIYSDGKVKLRLWKASLPMRTGFALA